MLNPLYNFVARAIVIIHSGLEPVFGKVNGYGWALSIMLLTAAVRIAIFPLFKKQIKAQRTMQAMQPQIKELREKYKYDKQEMNKQMVALQQEHGNPLLGCLPILAQIPLFIALFKVLNSIKPSGTDASGAAIFSPEHGLPMATVKTIATAKIFGVSIASSFTSSGSLLAQLQTSTTAVKIVTAVMIVTMGFTTYLTQRQLMGRNGPVEGAAATQQKVLLYASPLFLAIFGIRFPVGVLLYWLTTNAWSLGQQFFYIRKLDPVPSLPPGKLSSSASGVTTRKRATSAATTTKPTTTGATGAARTARVPLSKPPRAAAAVPRPQPAVAGRGSGVAAGQPRPGSRSRPPKRRAKGQRKGGRR